MESSWQCRLARHVMASVLNTRPCLAHTSPHYPRQSCAPVLPCTQIPLIHILIMELCEIQIQDALGIQLRIIFEYLVSDS